MVVDYGASNLLERDSLGFGDIKEYARMTRAWLVRGVGAFVLAPSLAWAAAIPCEQLADDLKSPMSKTRTQAVVNIAKQVCPNAVATLSQSVRDPDVEVRLAVVSGLRKLHDSQDVSALTTFTRDGSPEIRLEAVRGLIEAYSEASRRSPVDRLLDTFSDTSELPPVDPWITVDSRVPPALAERLRDENASIRRDAALAIGVLRCGSVAAELETTLNDPDAGVRARTVTAIDKLKEERLGKSIVPLLKDESADVRARALHAVMTLRVKEAGATLREMYTTNRPRGIQPMALEALSRVGDPAQRDLLLELAQDPDPERRRFAIEGLARIADRSMLAAFKKDFQRERSEDLRLAHAFALTYLGDRAFIDSLALGLSSRTMGARCRAYLVELGSGYLDDLYPYLRDPDAGIRAALAGVMGEIGDPSAIKHIEPLLKDPSSSVADEANRAALRLQRLRGMAKSAEDL